MGRTSERSGLQRNNVESALRPNRPSRAPPTTSGNGILDAQRGVGNEDVARMLGIQPKLSVNQPGDAYELEADRMADSITKSPDRPGAVPKPVASVVQRKPREAGAQRAEGKKGDDKKKPDAQKAPEKKGDDKKKPDAQKAPEKKGDDKKKPDAQKAPEKKGDEKKKPDAQKAPEKKGDDKKKPEAQKAPEKKEDDKKKPDAQKAPEKKTDDEKVQKAGDEPKTLEQEAVERDRKSEDAGPEGGGRVQAKEDDIEGGATSVPEDVERIISQQRGRGEPLSPQDRAFLEPRFGQDLSGVRIHTDAESQRAAMRLSAKAFTVGRDIFFAPGKFAPQSTEGLHLLAHEITHTIQQRPAGPPKAPAAPGGAGPAKGPATQGARPGQETKGAAGGAPGGEASPPVTPAPAAVVQRIPEPGPGVDPAEFTEAEGKLDEAGKTITFDKVKIPSFKNEKPRSDAYTAQKDGDGLKRPRAYNRDEKAVPDQKVVWDDDVAQNKDAHETQIREIASGPNKEHPVQGNEQIVLKLKKASNPAYFIGDVPTLAKSLYRPPYNRQGATMYFHVDHIVELQLNGGNKIENMELLHGPPNTLSGTKIENEIKGRISGFLKALKGDPQYKPSKQEIAGIKAEYELIFLGVETGENITVTKDQHWAHDEIKTKMDHLKPDILAPSSFAELGSGSDDKFFLFRDGRGGAPEALDTKKSVLTDRAKKWLKPFAPTKVDLVAGTIDFTLPEMHEQWKAEGLPSPQVTITKFQDAPRAGWADMAPLKAAARAVKKKYFSPIEIGDIESTEEGLEARGVIKPDLPLIKDTQIDFSFTGDDLSFSKTFDAGELASRVPPPFRVSQSTLTVEVSTGTPGFSVFGQIDFEVDRLGKGHVAGGASTKGFELEGKFNFDAELFDPAEITLRYKEERFSAEGKLGIKPGKVKGVKSANIDISYGNDVFLATGNAELDVPGVDKASLGVKYSEATGLEISGSATLAANLPGIQSGEIQAKLQKKPDGGWETFATGTAKPRLPVDAELSITYDNGALTVQGTGNYSKGMMSGSITLGATNRPIGPDGRPVAGAEGGKDFRAFGSGSVTLKFAPWLQGTVGIRLTPEGEIEVSGEVALPSALDLIPEKKYTKEILSIGLDIPIVGVAVAGQRIGIFATIRGTISFNAGIGPGQLQDLSLGVKYNPAHEDQTQVTGSARLHVPAFAGVRLAVQGGLGAGIPIVSATAGLEVGGELGVEGALSAGVEVDWTPARGLVIDASAEIYAQPKLKLDVSGFVDVSADLFLTTIELYHKRWQLAAVELGSNLRLGMKLPLHYEQGKDFDVSWDQVEFTIPDIDPLATLNDLIERVI